MRKQLRRLTLQQLADLAINFSITFSSKEELIENLVIYFTSYGLSWQDVAHRFQLKNGETKQ